MIAILIFAYKDSMSASFGPKASRLLYRDPVSQPSFCSNAYSSHTGRVGNKSPTKLAILRPLSFIKLDRAAQSIHLVRRKEECELSNPISVSFRFRVGSNHLADMSTYSSSRI
jgi:hypothetical protein